MKLLGALSILLCTASFVACGADDDDMATTGPQQGLPSSPTAAATSNTTPASTVPKRTAVADTATATADSSTSGASTVQVAHVMAVESVDPSAPIQNIVVSLETVELSAHNMTWNMSAWNNNATATEFYSFLEWDTYVTDEQGTLYEQSSISDYGSRPRIAVKTKRCSLRGESKNT